MSAVQPARRRRSTGHLFDDGWNKLRDRIFENQKRLGVIPADTQLEPWPTEVIKNWEDCTPEEQKLFIRQAEVFAAYAAYSGRVIQAVLLRDMRAPCAHVCERPTGADHIAAYSLMVWPWPP